MNDLCNGDTESVRVAATRDGRRLEYLTLGWNLIEAVIAIGAGWMAGSVALFGFGFDSVIESFSGAVLLWRLQSHVADDDRERHALQLVGVSFILLGAYVAFDSVKSLVSMESPDESIIGILLAAASLVVMPILAWAKRRIAARLDSPSLKADSRQTDICAYLSAILLAGLGLNVIFGWWWADPVAALIMVPIILREGVEALRGEHCSDCC